MMTVKSSYKESVPSACESLMSLSSGQEGRALFQGRAFRQTNTDSVTHNEGEQKYFLVHMDVVS